MFYLDKLAEDRIISALQRGELDNLPGAGMPLIGEDLSFVPEELRMAYKILKNSGHVPPELELRKEIHQLESAVSQTTDAATRRHYLKKLYCLYLKQDEGGQRQLNLTLQNDYFEKILSRLAGT